MLILPDPVLSLFNFIFYLLKFEWNGANEGFVFLLFESILFESNIVQVISSSDYRMMESLLEIT